MGDDKTELLRAWFDQVESQVQFGDSKAALLVAGDAILLTVCGGLVEAVSGCAPRDFAVSCTAPSVQLGLAAIAAGLLVVSLGCALLAARPSRVHAKPPAEFFLVSHIATMDRRQYVKAYHDASFDDLVEAALIAIHGKSMYASMKFRWLRRAVNSTLLSLGFIVATTIAALVAR